MLGGACGGAATLAAGSALAADPAVARGAATAMANPLRAFVRMRSGPDGGLAYWAYQGVVFGRLIDAPAQPLFNVVGIGIGRFTRRADGGFVHVNNEVGYFTDLKTGAPLGPWTNPVNGAACTLSPYKSRQHYVFRPDLGIELDPAPAGVTMQARAVVTPPRIQGRTLWMAEDLFVKASRDAPPGRPPLIATSLASFRIDVADLALPEGRMIPAQLYYETLGGWRPDMKMGDVPGVLSWRMTAEKAADASLLPQEVAGWMNRDYPGFLQTGA